MAARKTPAIHATTTGNLTGPATARSTSVDHRRRLLGATVAAADGLAIMLALFAAYHLRFSSGLFASAPFFSNDRPPIGEYLGFFFFGTASLLILLASFRAYEPENLLDRSKIPRPVLRGLFWWGLLYLSASLALKFDPPISRAYVALSVFTSAAGLTLVRLITLHWIGARHADWAASRVLLIGDTWSGRTPSQMLAGALPPMRAADAIPSEDCPLDDVPAWVERLTKIRESTAFDEVAIDNDGLPLDTVITLTAACETIHVPYIILPSFTQLFASEYEIVSHGRTAVLAPRRLPLDLMTNRMAKRCFDLLAAATGLVLLLPVMAAIALVVRSSSPGPALFSQLRYGRRGRPFRMFKFRTMHPGSEAREHMGFDVAKGDPRVIRCGHFLRRWNLDELPQLYNVLRGEMSLVGPRPEQVRHVGRLALEVRHYHFRHSVNPGMTGWAQVNGLRGDTCFQERIRHDIHYITQWDLLFDLQILLMTIFARWAAPHRRPSD